MFYYVTLEGPIKARNLKSLKPFFLSFFLSSFFVVVVVALACEQTFIKPKRTILKVDLSLGRKIYCFVGVCMHISARKFYRMWQ